MFKVLAVAVAAIVLGLVVLLTSTREKRVSRLPNGTDLFLVGVTHGPSPLHFPGGDERYDPRRSDGTSAYTNNAVVWTGQIGPSNLASISMNAMMSPLAGLQYKLDDFRATLADEKGEEWDTDPRTWPRPFKGNGISMVTPWNFPSFPRRGRTLRFRIYAHNDRDRWDTLADFTLPNPLPGPYPVWEPSKLPSVQHADNLQVSLVELATGTEAIPYYFGIRPFTRATFDVKENGQSTVAWVPDQLTAIDATGNQSHYFMATYRATNGSVYFEMQGTSLSPSEVWRLRARFPGPGRPFWTSLELPVQAGALLPTNLATNVQSFPITVTCEQAPFPNTIVLKVANLPVSAKLGHKIVDDQGRPSASKSGGFTDSGFDAQWGIPPGAKSLKVTLTLSETRLFEFLAQPTALPPANH
jgi:hypothetical protein